MTQKLWTTKYDGWVTCERTDIVDEGRWILSRDGKQDFVGPTFQSKFGDAVEKRQCFETEVERIAGLQNSWAKELYERGWLRKKPTTE
jgi:hypothetical protein